MLAKYLALFALVAGVSAAPTPEWHGHHGHHHGGNSGSSNTDAANTDAVNYAAEPSASASASAEASSSTASSSDSGSATSETFSGGQATYYNAEENTGACGYNNKNSELVVAVNTPQYTTGNCGKFVSITDTTTGNTAVARVVDECPTCDYGSLDMTQTLFKQLHNGNTDDGVFPITWHFTTPPAGEEEMSYAY